jgi:phosphoserine phosphatase
MPITVVHTPVLSEEQAAIIQAAIPGRLIPAERFHRLEHEQAPAPETLAQLREQLPFDINPLPEHFDPGAVRLLVTDMDSTLITIECIDEIADMMGRKAEVAAVTEAAMRGEIDFATSLVRRVAALEGLEQGALQQVYDERVALSPGAEELLEGLSARGIRIGLVSGGFTFFTDRLKVRLGLDYTRANVIEVENGRLTGRVVGDIVDAAGKARFLREITNDLEIDAAQTIAMGDGANDLEMMRAAGLGVAYRAKPTVQQQADVAFNHSGLDAVLVLLEAAKG